MTTEEYMEEITSLKKQLEETDTKLLNQHRLNAELAFELMITKGSRDQAYFLIKNLREQFIEAGEKLGL